MKRLTSLVCSLIVGPFMCAGASAHNPKSKTNYMLMLIGLNEILELVFVANCNVPQDDDDASIVPLPDREIIFDLEGTGRSSIEGSAYAWSLQGIGLSDGEATKVELPASTYGQLLSFRIANVSGQGVCKVSSTGRVAGASGETRGANLLDTTELWFIPVVNPDG